MPIKSSLSEHVQFLGEKIALDLSSVDFQDNFLSLSINKQATLNFMLKEENKECIIYAEFIRPTACLQGKFADERASMLSYLLNANVLLVGSNGACLAYDEESDTASISMTFDIPEQASHASKEAFYNKVERFILTYEHWSTKINLQ